MCNNVHWENLWITILKLEWLMHTLINYNIKIGMEIGCGENANNFNYMCKTCYDDM